MRDETFESLVREVASISVREEINGYPSDKELSKMYQLSDSFYPKMQVLIRYMERKETRKRYRRRIYICAACLLLLLICWKPDAVVNAGKAMWEWFDTHISFYFEKEETIIREYQIGGISNEYEMIYEKNRENSTVKTWKNKEGDEIELIYTYAKNENAANNEWNNFIVKYDGNTLIYYLESDKNDRNIMIWEDEENGISFTLISSLPYDEMIKIRQSIAPLEEP